MDIVKSLLRTLDDLISEHCHLVSLTEEQRQALVAGDDKTLQSLVLKIDEVVSAVIKAEERRTKLTEDMAKVLDLDGDSLTAEVLSSKLDEVSARHLTESVATLRNLVVQLVEQNERNRLLTEQSIAYIKHTIETVAGVTRTDGYGRNRKQLTSIKMFDVQA